MGANLEVFIISNKIISIDEILVTVNKSLGSCQITSTKIMDNWEYLNYSDIYPNDNFEEVLLQKKIVTIHASINNLYEAGAQFYMNNNSFISNLWFDTSSIPYLDVGYINTTNKAIYDNITHVMREKMSKYEILAVAIGVEMFVNENTNFEIMIRDSSNVSRWILFNSIIQNVNGFITTTINNPKTIIYSKIQ